MFVNTRPTKVTRTPAAFVALLLLGCSSAELNEPVHPELVDLDAPKSPSAGLIALADHAQALNAAGAQTGDDSAVEQRDVEVDNRAFASIEALCANFIAEAKTDEPALRESMTELGVDHVKAPYCTAIAEQHPVPVNTVFERAVAVRLSDGVWERKQLALKLARGFVLHPTYWDAVDPLDPGCPSIFRAENIEPLKVQGEELVVVESGRNYVDTNEKGDPVFAMAYEATSCKESEGKLACRRLEGKELDSAFQEPNTRCGCDGYRSPTEPFTAPQE